MEKKENQQLILERIQIDFVDLDNNNFWAQQKRFRDLNDLKKNTQWWVYVYYFDNGVENEHLVENEKEGRLKYSTMGNHCTKRLMLGKVVKESLN